MNLDDNVNSMNLIQKLAKIRGICDVAKKDLKGFNYSYVDITKILAKVTAGMKKYEVSLIPSINPATANVELVSYVNTKTDRSGKTYEVKSSEMLFTADMTFKWINDNNPKEHIDVPWFVTGEQPDPAQAMGTGLTYTIRQFLTSYFQIAQGDMDVDKYRSLQKEAEAAEDKAVTEAIIAEFDGIVRKFLSDNQERSDEVKQFISRYVKGANYKAIKDPKIAGDLLSEFRSLFLGEN